MGLEVRNAAAHPVEWICIACWKIFGPRKDPAASQGPRRV